MLRLLGIPPPMTPKINPIATLYHLKFSRKPAAYAALFIFSATSFLWAFPVAILRMFDRKSRKVFPNVAMSMVLVATTCMGKRHV